MYALRRTGGSNPSLSAKRRARETGQICRNDKRKSNWASVCYCANIGLVELVYSKQNDSCAIMKEILCRLVSANCSVERGGEAFPRIPFLGFGGIDEVKAASESLTLSMPSHPRSGVLRHFVLNRSDQFAGKFKILIPQGERLFHNLQLFFLHNFQKKSLKICTRHFFLLSLHAIL